MRKFLIPAALLVSTVAAVAPAAAQYAPRGYGNYGYQQNYGNQQNYGYQQNYGSARQFDGQLRQLRGEINQLSRQGILSRSESIRLDAAARSLDYRIRTSARSGISANEANAIQYKMSQLQQSIRMEASDRDGYAGNYGAYANQYGNQYRYNNQYGNYGYNNNYSNYDRDRDGRDDRYEDDRGTRRDD